MRYARTLLAVALVVGASGLSYAQQTIKGKIAAIDKAAGKISIQIAGTAGTAGSGTTNADATVAPTPFKVRQSATVQRRHDRRPGHRSPLKPSNGVATIKSLKKE